MNGVKRCFALLVYGTIAVAGIKGPQYYDMRSMGMGNTTVAVTTDRSALFHNPAGLSLIKEKVDISFSPLTFSIDGKFFELIDIMAKEGGKLTNLSNIDSSFINTINAYDGEWVGVEYTPEVTIAAKNIGFGIYSTWPVGVRLESGHLIPKLGIRGQRDLVFCWAVGVPLKVKNTHCGVSIEYVQRTPVSERITKYSETFILFDKFKSHPLTILNDLEEVKHGVSFDVGMMHNFRGFRIAYTVQDILGVIGGEIVVPPQLDIGTAYYFPQFQSVAAIENVIVAIEFSDIFGKESISEKYENFWKKVHAGAEIDLHYAAFRVGLNQGYPTAGIGLKYSLFKLDYVFFTEELGYYPGQLPKRKHAVSLGMNFKAKRLWHEREQKDETAPDQTRIPSSHQAPQKKDTNAKEVNTTGTESTQSQSSQQPEQLPAQQINEQSPHILKPNQASDIPQDNVSIENSADKEIAEIPAMISDTTNTQSDTMIESNELQQESEETEEITW